MLDGCEPVLGRRAQTRGRPLGVVSGGDRREPSLQFTLGLDVVPGQGQTSAGFEQGVDARQGDHRIDPVERLAEADEIECAAAPVPVLEGRDLHLESFRSSHGRHLGIGFDREDLRTRLPELRGENTGARTDVEDARDSGVGVGASNGAGARPGVRRGIRGGLRPSFGSRLGGLHDRSDQRGRILWSMGVVVGGDLAEGFRPPPIVEVLHGPSVSSATSVSPGPW